MEELFSDSQEEGLMKLYEEVIALRETASADPSETLNVYRKVCAVTEEYLNSVKNMGNIGELVVDDLKETISGEKPCVNCLALGNNSSVLHLAKLKNNATDLVSNHDKDIVAAPSDEISLLTNPLRELNYYVEELYELEGFTKTYKEVVHKFSNLTAPAKGPIATGGNITDSEETNNSSRSLTISDFSANEDFVASSPKSSSSSSLK